MSAPLHERETYGRCHSPLCCPLLVRVVPHQSGSDQFTPAFHWPWPGLLRPRLGMHHLEPYTPVSVLIVALARVGWSLFALPVCFWMGVLIALLPETVYSVLILPVTACCLLLSIGTPLVFDGTTGAPQPGF